MTHKPRLFQALRVPLSLLTLALLTSGIARADGPNIPKYQSGKIILYMQPGTPRAKVNALALKVKAIKVNASAMPDCYQLILPSDVKSLQDTLQLAAQLRPDSAVRWVNAQPVRVKFERTAPPNDPRYLSGEQWNLRMMNVPQAWTIQSGAVGVNVAVIDTAFNPNHEDLTGQYLPESKNYADDPIAGNAPITSTIDRSHGVHVSGIIAAKTDNGKGIAGVCWDNVKVLAFQTTKTADKDSDGMDYLAILSSANNVAANKDALGLVAVNMSYGGFGDPNDVNDPEYVAMQSVKDAGVVPMAAAGNSEPFPNTSFVPCGYASVVSVGSVGPSGGIAFYSQGPKVEFAAPGGDQSGRTEDGILSTYVPSNNSYEYLQGTSMACPDAVGVMALILSTPGVTPDQAVQAVKDTANKAGLQTIPDSHFGYGVIDAYQALLQVSVQARIQAPNGLDANGNSADPSRTLPPVETFQPTIQLKIGLAKPEKVAVTFTHTNPKTGMVIVEPLEASFLRQNVVSGDPDAPRPQYTVSFRKKFRPAAKDSGDDNKYTLSLTATSDTGLTRTDTRVFTLEPRVLTGFPLQGVDGKVRRLAFISLPYAESALDSPTGATRDSKALLGPNSVLYRYVYKQNGSEGTQGGYAIFGSPTDKNPDDAKLLPSGPAALQPRFEGSDKVGAYKVGDSISPVGYAWFADLPETPTLQLNGVDFGSTPVRIPLTEGWNMIGNPFPYSISLNTSLLEMPTGERVPMPVAAEQNLVLPFLYRYFQGQYFQDQLPNGLLVPWEGHWIFVSPARRNSISLINKYALLVIPGVVPASGRSASLSKRTGTIAVSNPVPVSTPAIAINGPSSWGLRLEAQVGNLRDGNNYIGMTSIGANQRNRTRVPKPPMPTPYVSVGIANSDSPGLLYSQDLQSIGGSRTWEVVVATDQQKTDIALNTNFVNALPRNYRLTLTDKVTGQSVDLRNQRTYRYNTGTTTPTRGFLITARPSNLGRRALVTSVFVNPSKPADTRSVPTYEIGYNISQEANVEVSILSATGRQIAVVGNSRAVNAGDNRAVWTGRDNAGRTVPAGTYLVQLRATTTDGEVSRVAQPLLVTGR